MPATRLGRNKQHLIKPVRPTFTEEQLSAKTVPELKEQAAELGIDIPSKYRKADIIEAILGG